MASVVSIIKLCLLLAFLSAFSIESRKVLSSINDIGKSYYGLISASSSVETAFLAAADFVPDSEKPYVDLAGRRFRIGTVHQKNVVVVSCGTGLVNAALTTQILLDNFPIYGVVHFGVSGNTNSSLEIGDVVIPNEFIHTGLWDWLNPNVNAPSNDVATLDVADYTVPSNGASNKLGRIGYAPEEFYSKFQDPEQKLWFPVAKFFLEVASKLPGTTKLENCIDENSCLTKDPEIVIGLKGSSSNAFIDNAAYRNFLYQTFDVSSADMESSAVVMTCLSNGNHGVIVVRGLANLAGGEDEEKSAGVFNPLATTNVAKVVDNLVKELPFPLLNSQF